MKRIFAAILFSLWSQVASAGISCSLPFTLTNGTTADATQVMANYNALVACLASAATAGANTDITSLLGLTTPLPSSEGGTQWFIGGTSTGSGNAQVVASLTPGNFTLTPGTFVGFIAGFSNTGATTWNINGKGATNVLARTSAGLAALGGGEIVATQVALGFYDGTQFQLLSPSPTGNVQPCTEIDYQGVTVPSGYLFEDGSAVSRTTYSALFSCMAFTSVSATTSTGSPTVTVGNSGLYNSGYFVGGNNVTCNATIINIPDPTHITLSANAGGNGATTLTIGPQPQGDCSTTFNIPNQQGRASVGADPANSTLSQNACAKNGTVGQKCGSTTQQIALGNLPNITVGGSLSVTVTSSPQNFPASTATVTDISASTSAGGTHLPTSGTGFANASQMTGSTSGTMSSSGLGTNNTAFLLQPVGLVAKAIKF